MEAEIWQKLPEELLFMILARLPIRVLGKMRTVCKQWSSLLSSRDALKITGPNWSLHSTPGFLLQIKWEWYDVEYWVIEGRAGSDIYKIPLLNRVVVDTCNGISFCHTKENKLDLSIGIPGTGHWRELPRPPISRNFSFSGMTFDSSTRRCTLLIGCYYIDMRPGQQVQGQNITIEMCIYDSESNAWTAVSMMVPNHIKPYGNGIYSRGKFYWTIDATCCRNLITAFNIADRQWTEIPLPQGGRWCGPENLGEYDGQVVLVDQKELDSDFVRIWKLNEAERYEVWCELRANVPIIPFVNISSNGLMMVTDSERNLSIFNSKGKLVVENMKLPGNRMSQKPSFVDGFAFESNNLWWP